ncbi:MAG: anthranilate synthase component I family protein, partial [Lachnospiraceae bacterium]|nr:anthranilate synthase component I family protein [Lachnospiraceae bacterium]
MQFRPTLEEIKEIAASGRYKVVPVSCEILSDVCTPIEAMRKLKNISTHCYMLESVAESEKWGRYTFLGYDPKLAVSCKDGLMQAGGMSFTTADPSAELRKIMSDYTSPRFDYLPSFTGGFVGYFSFDYLFYSEPTAKVEVTDDDAFRDMDLMLFDKVIAYDNYKQKIILIANMKLSDCDTGYNRAKMELTQMAELIKNGAPKREKPGRLLGPAKSLFSKEEYCEMVEKAKHHIKEGDIFQIVLSNRMAAPFEGSLLDTYRMLRTINPSPYMFYFAGTDVEVAGASPETLVKLENGVLHTFPLAGTRPRGKTDEEDKRLEEELLADEKELAEHNMLVDLGRNDLGKISRFGSVEVKKFHT